MRNRLRRAVAQTLTVALLAGSAFGLPLGTGVKEASAAAAPSSVNLGFETGDLTGWSKTGTAAAQTADKHGGASAVKLSAANSSIAQTITGIEQGSYTLSAWVKGSTSSTSNAAAMTATNTGGPDTRLLIDGYISSTEWTQVSLRNVLVYNGQATVTFASGSGTNLMVDDIELTLDSSDENPVANWDFETGSLAGWTIDAGTAAVGSSSDTGTNAAVLSADSQISQTVAVKPNTDYIATVRAKVDRQDTWETIYQSNYLGNTGQLVNVTAYGDRINLGVKNLSGTVLRQAPDGTAGYALLTIRFKTGPSDDQVVLYANTLNDENYRKSVQTYNSQGGNASHDGWTGNGTDKAYVDNFDLFEIDNSTVKGADVSFLPVIEDNGGKYFANGVQQDCLTILANHGVNAVTGMLFVHAGNAIYDQSSPKQQQYTDFTDEDGNPFPYTMQAGYFDKTHALALAERAQELDIGYLPSFHFSDAWMSAGKAFTPLDWMYKNSSGALVDQSLDEMTTTMYNYVYDFIKALVDQGTTPMGVKIGNEQDGGIAWPNGKGYSSSGFKALINAAYDAVHDAAPGVSAFIHTNNGYNPDNSNTVFGKLTSNGVKFDGQAYSLYGGHTSDAIPSMLTNDIANYPDQDYLDVETGYSFTKYNPDYADESGSMGQTAYYVASSPNGQYNWLLDYMQALREVANPHDRMRGFFYWETDWIVVEGAGYATRGANTVDRRTMFNNGDTSIKEMGSTANGKMGDMMDSMYAYLWRGHAKNKPETAQTPLKGFGTYSVTKTSPTGITLNQSALSLTEGKTTRLLPTIAPDSNASSNKLVFDSSLTWTSSDPSVAKVNAAGYVTAVGTGTARITATTVDGGLSASADVTVVPPTDAAGLTLKVGGSVPGSTVSAKVWDQQTLVATLPAGTTNKRVTFTSSDPSVASFLGEFWQSSNPGTLYQQSDVTANVKLNVKHDGTTVITATSADGLASASYTLNVTKIPVASVTLNKTSATVSLGRTQQLTATVAPADASFNTLSWTSSDPTVATVDASGLVTTLATGTTTITATSDDDASIKATSVITVVPVMVTGISLSKSALNIMVDSTKPIVAILAPDDAYNKTVNWTSSDETVATVDANGNVTGVTVGTATITATTADGGYTATTTVTVQSTPVAVTGVALDVGSYYFASDYFSTTNPAADAPTKQLVANVVPADATNTDVVWTSNNPTIASVDAYGKVTAIKAGVAVIAAKTKDGSFEADATVYVPSVSESFDNRTLADNWSAAAGSAAAFATVGVAAPAGVGSQVFSLASSGSGARAEYKSFSVANNKIVLNFDWNVGAPGYGTGQLRIQDSAHNNYITFGIPTGGSSSIVYDTSAAIVSNTAITGTAVAASGFKTASATYNVQVTLDMAAKKTSFTLTNKADSGMTTTVSNLAFDSGTAFNNNLGYLEFYTTRPTGTTATWTTWLDNFNVYTAVPAPVSVTLSKSSLSLLDIPGTPGNTAQLTAAVNPNMAGVDQSVTWSSSDTSVATVGSSGLVTAIADGDAVITATSTANTALSASAAVSVHPIIPVEAIGIKNGSGEAIDGTIVNLSSGSILQLTSIMNPGTADYRSIAWSSSKTGVATVDSSGLLTAVGPGEATITLTVDAYADKGGYQGSTSFTLVVSGDAVLNTLALQTAIEQAIAAKTYADDYYTADSLSAYKSALTTAQNDLAAASSEQWDVSYQSRIDGDAAALNEAAGGLAKSSVIPATGVALTPSALTLTAGKSGQLTASVAPAYSTSQVQTWTSSDPAVAVVANGVVTAVGVGTATITAATENGKTAQAAVTVTSDLSSGYASNGGSIAANKTKSGYYPYTPVTSGTAWTSGANLQTSGTPVTWQIDLGSLARIDNVKMTFWQTMKFSLEVSNDGTNWTTAVDNSASFGGATTVFTTAMPANTVGQHIRLTIYGVSTTTDWVGLVYFQANGAFISTPASISLDRNSASLNIGETLQLAASLAPTNADPRVTWASSDTGIATVSASGLVTAIGGGTATITASSSNGLTALATVSVTGAAVSVAGVGVAPSELSLEVGTTGQLTATVLPSDATNKSVTWSTSDANVAAVDAGGVVTAKAAGTAVITATTADGAKTATATVTVTAIPSDRVAVAPVAALQNGSRSDFIMGADVSELHELEKYGKKFYDTDGSELSALQILQNHGVNYIRLRLWNDPTDAFGDPIGGGNTDLASVIATAKNAKSLGMKVLLDFHYSDFWADPGKQNKPKAWANDTGATLQQDVYDFTYASIDAMREAGALPDMVQIGNEINGGLLWTDGNSASKAAPLLQKASEAVRAVDSGIQIMIHLAGSSSGAASSFTTNFDAWTSGSTAVDFDLIGISAYPYWHGTIAQNATILSTLASRYNKPVVVAETAYAWTLEPGDETINNFDQTSANTAGYTPTPQGQAAELRDIINNLANVPNDMGLGLFYWGADWLPGNDTGWITGQGSGWENQALFDYTGKALPSIDVFNLVRTSTATPASLLTATEPYYTTINAGSSPSLPSTVSGRYSDGYYKSVAVDSWDTSAISLSTPGIYTALGTVGGVAGAAKAVVTVQSAQPTNLVVSPGLETASSNWTINSPLTRKSNATDAHAGSYALHFSTTTTAKTAYQTITGLANGTYTYSVWAEAYNDPASPDVFIYATGYDAADSAATLKQSVTFGSWGAWNQYSITVPVTSGTVTIGVSVKAAGTMYGDFDDFYFGLPPADADPSTLVQTVAVQTIDGTELEDGDTITAASPYVKLSTATPDATIFYSIDGSTPAYSSGSSTTLVYTGPIRVASNTVLKFYATAPGYVNSPVSTYAFKYDSSDAGSAATGGGFEQAGDLGGWTLTGVAQGDDNATYVFDSVADAAKGVVFAGGSQFKYWQLGAYSFTLSRTITGLADGVYKLSAVSSGKSNYATDAAGRATNNAAVATLTLKASTPTTQASANVINQGTASGTGWNVWHTFSVSNIVVTDGTVTIAFEASAAADYWGYLDDIKLVRVGDYASGSISGTVKDTSDHPVAGATVELTLNGSAIADTTTDENGDYSFESVLAGGGYTVSAGKAGYTSGSITEVTVVEGNSTTGINPVVTADAVAATGVELNKTTISLAPGGTDTLIATVKPSNATNQDVTWTSSNETVATVSESGVVTAVGEGTAVITVTTDDGGYTATANVTVASEPETNEPVSATGVELNKTTISLAPGGTDTLIATVKPSNATNQDVTWTSSNETVATVSESGVVTAVGEGTAVITATTDDGGYTATANVTVASEPETNEPVAATGVELNKMTVSLSPGGTDTLIATVKPSNATNQDVTWTSSNETVATVSESGVVTAVAEGTAVITVTTGDGGYTAEANVTVASEPVVQAPNAPTGLAATAQGTASIKLVWSPADNAVSYAVYRSASLTGTYAQINVEPVTGAAYTDTGLASGTTYYYQVTAINEAGESAASAVASATTTSSGGNTGNNGNNGNTDSGTDASNGSGSAAGGGSTEVAGSTITVRTSAGSNGTARATLTAEAVKQAAAAAKDGKLVIRVQPDASSASKAEVTLPVQAALESGQASQLSLSALGIELSISLKAADGLVSGDAKELTAAIAAVASSELSKSAQDRIGSHPVFNIGLTVDGKAIANAGQSGAVTVTVPYDLQAGEKAHEIVIYSIGDDGELKVVKNAKYDAASGTITFEPQSFGTYAVGNGHANLNDLNQAEWARTMIESLAARGIVTGTGTDSFEPGRSVTRAEFLKLLLSALDLTDAEATSGFADISSGAWYYQAVATAEKLGIVKGKADGTFGANETITREDMAVMLSRAAAAANVKLGGTGMSSPFADGDAISSYASDAVNEMQQAGLINGFTDGTFGPKQQATRAQAAAVIYKLLGSNG
ncbi:glycosyl hydrolase 53 family protein [Cohnella fermenti]|nr:glycosyl hydrolase 53 family protein [Cohnella fermenti]